MFYTRKFTKIILPKDVTSIGSNAFDGCSSLTGIDIPSSVTSIGERAFYDCSSLTSITIPNSVTSIGNNVINYCSKLEKLYCYIQVPFKVTLGSGKDNCTLYVPKGTKGIYMATSDWNKCKEIVEMEE